MRWKYQDLKEWIQNGCDPNIAKNVVRLDISDNEISEIPKEIGQLINLRQFYCTYNKISEIPKEIGQLINLREFWCCNNKISEIPKEIGQLIDLQKFNCIYNQISEIPKEIGQLINLQEFNCCKNKISEIPIEITMCIYLQYFYYSHNAIEYIPPQVIRFLNRNKFVQKVYNDTQSVHNHNIQECISNSIIYIMQKKPHLTSKSLKIDILNNNILEQKTKELLFEYIEDKTVHSVLNITFEELLISVYDYILNHEHKQELFIIMIKEMNDSICKCFTGRMSRLINVLNGFDENIKIQISEAEQIGNICIIIKQKLEDENRFTDELFKEIVEKELLERNYDKATIKEWLENI
jgi:Leucine-rich repeat (LRR) protein